MTRLRLLKDGAIGRVVLARPEKKNALDRQAADDLFAALAQFEGDATIRAIVTSQYSRPIGWPLNTPDRYIHTPSQ